MTAKAVPDGLPAAAGPAGRRRAWRSLESGDFPAILAATPMAKSPHFVLQHLAVRPASAARRPAKALVPELSTAGAPTRADSVDNIQAATQHWLGLVVPKRHAKRAVTRNLLKRQMRAVVDRHSARMAPGQWLIRLRAPFDAHAFPSAASAALREVAGLELQQLLVRGVIA